MGWYIYITSPNVNSYSMALKYRMITLNKLLIWAANYDRDYVNEILWQIHC